MADTLGFRQRGSRSFTQLTPYFTQDAAIKLRQYKYAGGDSGILYKYFYNPVALKLVSILPETVAPNLLTLIGFLFTVIPFALLFGLYGLDFHGNVPAWWCYLEAASYFIYRMLDEMDGKQARKTGNSSPLGLLFDHGCDAFTAGLITLMALKLLQVGNNPLIILGLVAVTQAFHFSTLEEYYIGGLYLGIGNGVTDGSALLIALFIQCGISGQEFWRDSVSITLNNSTHIVQISHLFVYGMFISQILAVLYIIYSVIKHQTKDIPQEQRDLGEPLDYSELLKHIVSFYMIYSILSAAVLCQSTNSIIYTYPMIPCMIGVFLYVHNTISIQVAHVSKQKYYSQTRLLMFNVFIMMVYIGLLQFQVVEINQQIFFSCLMVITGLCQWHYILNVIYEMTVILNIKVFKVKPKNQLFSTEPLREEGVQSQIEMQEVGRNNDSEEPDIESTNPSNQNSGQKNVDKNLNYFR
eukprot:403340566